MTIQKFLNPVDIINQVVISENSIVADFGAGLGHYAEKLSKDVGEGGKVYLIDIQKDVLGRVKNDFDEKGIKNVEYINSNLEEENGSKIASGSVDFVLIASVLFQSLEKENIVKEAVRILAPNGRILIVE
jgi:ubiquinone/menaquinone biosynthesis C-methylase UbiE